MTSQPLSVLLAAALCLSSALVHAAVDSRICPSSQQRLVPPPHEYTIPSNLYRQQMDPVNSQHCYRAISPQLDTRCEAGPDGYEIDTEGLGLDNAAACASACLSSDICTAYSWTPATSGCTHIGSNPVGAPRRGRKMLLAAEPADEARVYEPYVCEAQAGARSGFASSARASPITQGVAWASADENVQLTPYNLLVTGSALRTSSAEACAEVCAMSRFKQLCSHFTWNAGTSSCYLYESAATLVSERWDAVADCQVFSGRAISNCWQSLGTAEL